MVQTSQSCGNLFIPYIYRTMSKQNIELSKQIHTVYFPIHKEGAKSNMNNYRPISVISIIAKAIEKHVQSQFYSYLQQSDILTNSQHPYIQLSPLS